MLQFEAMGGPEILITQDKPSVFQGGRIRPTDIDLTLLSGNSSFAMQFPGGKKAIADVLFPSFEPQPQRVNNFAVIPLSRTTVDLTLDNPDSTMRNGISIHWKKGKYFAMPDLDNTVELNNERAIIVGAQDEYRDRTDAIDFIKKDSGETGDQCTLSVINTQVGDFLLLENLSHDGTYVSVGYDKDTINQELQEITAPQRYPKPYSARALQKKRRPIAESSNDTERRENELVKKYAPVLSNFPMVVLGKVPLFEGGEDGQKGEHAEYYFESVPNPDPVIGRLSSRYRPDSDKISANDRRTMTQSVQGIIFENGKRKANLLLVQPDRMDTNLISISYLFNVTEPFGLREKGGGERRAQETVITAFIPFELMHDFQKDVLRFPGFIPKLMWNTDLGQNILQRWQSVGSKIFPSDQLLQVGIPNGISNFYGSDDAYKLILSRGLRAKNNKTIVHQLGEKVNYLGVSYGRELGKMFTRLHKLPKSTI